jgi:pyrroline-5-carboxylate reductase
MQIGLIGAGNMARGLARGWGRPVLCTDVLADRAQALADETGGEALQSNAEVAQRADLVFLCHKPPQLPAVAAEIASHAKAIASILAATTTAALGQAYPDVPVYRFIPNIPAEVRRGVLCYVPGPRAAEGPEAEVLDLFGRAGTVIRLEDEPLIEPAMALMSCGPAFMALVAESFADAGADHGLGREEALQMVVETMGGTAAYLAHHGYDTGAVKVRVATPGALEELLQQIRAAANVATRTTVVLSTPFEGRPPKL